MQFKEWHVEIHAMDAIERVAVQANKSLEELLREILYAHERIESREFGAQVFTAVVYETFVTVSIQDERHILRLVLVPSQFAELEQRSRVGNLVVPFYSGELIGLRIIPPAADKEGDKLQ